MSPREVVVLVLTPAARELLERSLRDVAARNGDLRHAAEILEQLAASTWTPRELVARLLKELAE